MATLDKKTIGSVEHDRIVREIAAKYRDSDLARFAINDYRDRLIEEIKKQS